MKYSGIVYVIDAAETLGEALGSLLNNYEIKVIAYTTTESLLERETIDQIANCRLLLSLGVDCEAGIEQVKRIKVVWPGLAIVVLCEEPSDSLRTRYVDAGAVELVGKSMVDAYVFTRLAKSLPGAAGLPATQPSMMQLANGTRITFRMIRPDDIEIERKFVIDLSDRSRYMRFFSGLKKLPDHLLRQLTDPQFPISYALIATIQIAGEENQIGVARYAPTDARDVAEFAVVIADDWQGHGIATELLRGIVTAATVAGIRRLEGLILRENVPMLRLARALGFATTSIDSADLSIVTVVKELS